MIEYREAKKDEIKMIANMVAETFEEYPMYSLTFRDKFKTKDDFIKYMKKLNKVHILANAKKHKCIVGLNNGMIISVALLQNPRVKRVTLFDYILSGGVSLLFPVGFKRLIDFFKISNVAHEDCERTYPDAFYIELLAVSKNFKGHGVGSMMINECLIPYAKNEGANEICLITNTEKNCVFYVKNGFINFSHSNLNWNDNSIENWSFVKYLSGK